MFEGKTNFQIAALIVTITVLILVSFIIMRMSSPIYGCLINGHMGYCIGSIVASLFLVAVWINSIDAINSITDMEVSGNFKVNTQPSYDQPSYTQPSYTQPSYPPQRGYYPPPQQQRGSFMNWN